ncbi:MAG TPA: hypothetical protein VGB77_18450 [Abditibacteriaceae bacterium]
MQSTVSNKETRSALTVEQSTSRPPNAVKWIILAFFCVATLVQFLVLLDFGPDEPWHVDYVYTLAVEHRLPTPQSDPVTPKPNENHLVQHPPLYYAGLAVIWKLCGTTQKPLAMQRGITSYGTMEPNALLARRLMRGTSALLCCLMLWLMARTLALLQIPARWQILLIAGAASWPMLQYVGGVVNNENAAYAYSALLCFVLIARWKADTCTPKQAFFIGLLCGAGALVKQNTLFAVPLALWIILLSGAPRVQKASLFCGGALLTGMWWPLYHFLTVGDPFPTFTPNPTQPSLLTLAQNWPIIVKDWLPILLNSAFLPDWSLLFVDIRFETTLVLLIVGGFIFLFALGLRAPQSSQWKQLRAISFTGMVLLLLGVLQYCAFKDQRAHIGGRYLLNALPWALVFLAASLPLFARHDKTASQSADLANTIADPPASALLPIGFLLLIDAAWWFIAWTHYQTQVAAELQRRLGG